MRVTDDTEVRETPDRLERFGVRWRRDGQVGTSTVAHRPSVTAEWTATTTGGAAIFDAAVFDQFDLVDVTRKSFPVTDPELDAPDGVVVRLDDNEHGGGVWERVGTHWQPRPDHALTEGAQHV